MNLILVFLIIPLFLTFYVCSGSKKTQTPGNINEDEFHRLENFYDSSRPPPIELSDEHKLPKIKGINPKVKELMSKFRLTNNQLKEYERRLIIDLNKGLNKQSHNNSIVKCYVTYMQHLPTGHENGTYLAIDLGGTNFRVLKIELNGRCKLKMKSMQFAIPPKVMTASGHDLFSYLADCVEIFVNKYNLTDEDTIYPMGFTFSFPLNQGSLNKAFILKWTKGFKCMDVIGQDVVNLLQEALLRRGISNIKITVVINDTTGTLMTAAWKNPKSKIGLIIGTGTNACYIEKQKTAELFDDKDRGSGQTLINTEWGAFGEDGSLDFLRTPIDIELDSQTINPGRQVHEKMISGMYMGEIVRRLLICAVKDGYLFGGRGSTKLFTGNMFATKFVSEIENQQKHKNKKCMQILDSLGLPDITEEDCSNLKYICSCVSMRAAHMISAGICALIRKMGETDVAVGIDGAVYTYHPLFHQLMIKKINELVIPGTKVTLMLSQDGSGRGAALAAAVVAKYEEYEKNE